MSVDIEKITDEYKFSEVEKNFVKGSGAFNDAAKNQSRVISELILGKQIKEATNKIIVSNEKLAVSNEKYSKRMLWLTWALVFVGIVQAAIQLL